MAASPLLERTLGQVWSLPFAGPSALVLTQAALPASRDILIVAHHEHGVIIDAIERRQAARAEALTREHAQLAITNLEIAMEHRDVMEKVPGGALLTIDGQRPRQPV